MQKDGVSSAFYFSAATPNDWTLPQNADLWQDANKTLFDPCPSGWRVPSAKNKSIASPWYNLTLDSSQWRNNDDGFTGRIYSSAVVYSGSAWYPTSGRRSPNGYFSVYGTHGQYWSASTTSTIGNILSVSQTSSALDITNHHRAYGFPVRCVRE